ncbi:MAG: SDR family NAD(P)-dependent oxidoreductase [Betaproteobacteria bacterium]
MNQHLYIVTGASRGMGLEIALQLLRAGHRLLCISRQSSQLLERRAQAAAVPLLQWQQDLALGEAASVRLSHWLRDLPQAQYASATLINNAGVIPRLVPLSQSDPQELAQALRVGLEAPMQLTAAFLRCTETWNAQRRVLNISSGLGRHAMASQAGYCAAKAGMDHFTRCLALDEAQKPRGARVCSLAPGVIDTEMQLQLRSADAALFPAAGNFAALKQNGQLASPTEAAAAVLAYLTRADFGENPVADVRDA